MNIDIKRTNAENSEVELFVDGISKGIFSTEKKAKMYFTNLNSVTTIGNGETVPFPQEASSASDVASQKIGETTVVKKRGRPRKAGNNDRVIVL